MHIEIKIAQWKRINIPKKLEKEFRNKLMNQEITESDKAILYLQDRVDMVKGKYEEIAEIIKPENNYGEGTFQVYDNNNNLLFSDDILDENNQYG